jgi:hypothetical protein
MTGFLEMFRIGAPALGRLPWVSADCSRPPNIVLLNDLITLQRPYSSLWKIASVGIVPAPKFYIEQTGRHAAVASG